MQINPGNLRSRSMGMKHLLIVATLVGITACGTAQADQAAPVTTKAPVTTEAPVVDMTSAATEAPVVTEASVVETPLATEAPAPVVEAPVTTPQPSMSASQENAIREAQSYLDFSAFSRQGLIDQLSSEYGSQFPVEDATFAVDSLNADWNEQAAKEAQSYLDYSGFSCQSLIEQLSSQYGSKFTLEEATYGATTVGLC